MARLRFFYIFGTKNRTILLKLVTVVEVMISDQTEPRLRMARKHSASLGR